MAAKTEEQVRLEASLLHNGNSANWDSQTTWDDVADLYDLAIGRTTQDGAPRLIELANERLPFEPVPGGPTPPPPPMRRAIDLGAGTGSLTLPLAARFPALEIVAVDISAGMLRHLSAKWRRSASTAPPSSSFTSVSTQVADMAAPLLPSPFAHEAPPPHPSSSGSGGGDPIGALPRSLAGSFSHALSMAAVQATSDNLGCLRNMYDLLAPGGCCTVGNWDFENECAVHDVWALASTAADPTYKVPPIMPPGRWAGMAELEAGMRQAGFVELRKEIVKCRMPAEDGTEGFVSWFFESKNPASSERLSTFSGDKDLLRAEMRRVLDERYERGTRLIMDVDVVVGTKPA